LTEVPATFAEVLAGLIGQEAQPLTAGVDLAGATEGDRIKTGDDLDVWEHRLEERVAADMSIDETDREAIIQSPAWAGAVQTASDGDRAATPDYEGRKFG
jgi:hypothetical protein